jgi:hypothetical protein
MGSRTKWAIAGGLAVVIAVVAVVEISRQHVEPGHSFEKPGQDARSLPAEPEPSPSAGYPRVEEPKAPLAGEQLLAEESRAAMDPPAALLPADAPALDPETGWPYSTRARVEQALYQALDTPGMRGAAFADQLSCGDGKCRFELGLVQPLSTGNAHLVSNFMADLDARLLADEASSGVQVYLERFSPRIDGTGAAVLSIDSRNESPVTITLDGATGESTIRFPERPDGGG